MDTLTVSARFDGEKILLNEPYELKPDMRLFVTIMPAEEDEDRADWLRLSMQNFAAGHDDDEPEYSLDKIKEWNPDYEGR